MSIAFPENALAGGEPFPTSTSDIEVEVESVNPALLMAIGLGYHRAQTALATLTQRRTFDLWLRSRPVNDDAMRNWLRDWDALLAQSSRQQSALTESYVRTSLRAFAAPAEMEPDVPAGRAADVARWLDSDVADLDPDLHSEASALLARLRAKQADLADLSRADRLPWLHSPVIDARTRLGSGQNVDQAFAEITARLGSMTDAALRTAESDVISGIRWPRFKDGKAMVAKRVPQAGACGWCRVVATRLYSLESFKRSSQWHGGCRCTWTLLTPAEAERYASVAESTAGEGGTASEEFNYYKAAESIGLWSGPTERGTSANVVGERFDPTAAAAAGFISTRTIRGAIHAYDPDSGTYQPV